MRTDEDIARAAALTGRVAAPVAPIDGTPAQEVRSKEELAREPEEESMSPEEAALIAEAIREGKPVPAAAGDEPAVDDSDDYEELLNKRFGGDPIKAVESYRNLEKKLGEQGNELGKIRKQMQEAGWAWDAAGDPVRVNIPKQQEPAPQDTPRIQVPADPDIVERYEDGTYKKRDGNIYDHIGMLVVDDEAWAILAQENPTVYAQAYAKYSTERMQKQMAYDRSIEEVVNQRQQVDGDRIKDQIAKISYSDKVPLLNDIRDRAFARFKSMPKDVQTQEGAMDVAWSIELAPHWHEVIEKLLQAATADITEKVTSNKRTIAHEGGTISQPSAEADAGLTREQEAARVNFIASTGRKVSKKEWKDLSDAR